LSEKSRILIIDDDPVVASTVAEMVRALGHFPIVAWDKESALSIWRETDRAFDLVIIDYLLGKTSGAKLAVKLGSEQPNVPFILISGMPEHNVETPPGRVSFLAKPFSIDTLKKRIDAVLKKKP
jgi:DNA-binding NtrC family response regulator